ncbi:MAG: JAB domain-containing protein [Clostridium sp.]|nr:JAB domain-containing protein [Clostridium sp.]MCM1550069.1 JAB domain-containing protein [Clostridium sp.]
MKKNQKGEIEVVSIRLVKDAPVLSEHKICTPKDAVVAMGEFMCDMDREVVCIINLKTDGTPINCHFASMGAVNQSIACPRELFKSSILSNAATMILVHNHPSGCLFPSKEDTMLTDKLLNLCDMMGIPLLDHVIVGGDNREYFSFREKEMMKNPYYSKCTDYKELKFEIPMIAGKSR